MSQIISELTNLSPQEKRALLAQLLREKASQTTTSAPLSYGQQALWFLYQRSPESAAYNVAFTARVRSQIDVPALRRSFQTLLDRHPALRTTFATRANGEPVQEVHGYQELWFEQADASTWTGDELNKQVIAAYQRPFDLEQGPVMRVHLFTCAEQDHILLLTIHHIVIDGWSLSILLDEFRVLYAAEHAGTQISLPPKPDGRHLEGGAHLLPPLTLTYPDYGRKQAEMLAGPAGEQLWAYWRQQLSGELSVLNLPTDRPRPRVQTDHGASYTFKFSAELTRQLRELAQTEGVTLYMLLLAAFQVLLYRYTSQENLLIGSPTTGRSQTEFAGVVGYFVNMLVLRADLSGNPTFKTLLSHVRRTVLDALAYQDYPFPLLVERLQPNRDPSRTPLFQASFGLKRSQQVQEIVELLTPDKPDIRINWGGLELEPFDMPQEEGQFDVVLDLTESQEFLSGVFRYNADLFEAATITRMIGHFKTLLAGIVINPEQRLSALPILTEAEQHQILVAWNDTKTDYPQDKCIHELFEAQAERTPDDVAVMIDDCQQSPIINHQLTYQELNVRANQLAHHLRMLGVGPEVLVGLCVERSVEMVVGLLGILKAGGAYVALDPTYPAERLAFMLEDAGAPIVLTQEKLLAGLPAQQAHLICLDRDWQEIAQACHGRIRMENLDSAVTPDNLAYVIYTSGSTGKPKGVLLAHRGLCNLAEAQIRIFDVQPGDRILQFASLSFDVATSDVVIALCSGAMLCLAARESLLPGPGLLEVFRKFAITHVELPASILTVVPATELPALKVIIVGGEPCPPDLVARWAPGRRFFNAYGPTEATVCATLAECSADTRTPPIGRPLANTQIYILDRDLQPVPIGVPGELHIAGVGLARGYLHRPDLTAEKFIPNPFGSGNPLLGGGGVGRLYKTGDLARYLPDGNIEFLGRIDQQIKIRGFRVELGEIEAVLAGYPAVQEAVVLVREDHPGDKRLVAYLVLSETAKPVLSPSAALRINFVEGAVTPNDLRGFLKEKLPDYMIPSAFVILKALPLTPNGKVDRRALPAPEISRSDLQTGYVAPRTHAEQVLAEIWAEVLKLKQVGMHDNFFELGGDSILSIQIIARANKAGLQLRPNHLFQYQTIAELATVTGTIQPIQAEQGIVTGVAPLTPIQHWFFEQHLPEPQHWNQALLLDVRETLDPSLLEKTVQQLLVHHDALRLRFIHQGSQWRQEHADLNATRSSPPGRAEGWVYFLRFDLSQIPEPDQPEAIATAAAQLQTSLNLSEGPLMRVALFDLGEGKANRLLLVIHHLVVDGVSWRILLEDLQTAYQQLYHGEQIQLPPKTTSFKDWACRLTEYATTASHSLAAETDYWLKTLSRVKITPLPVDSLGSVGILPANPLLGGTHPFLPLPGGDRGGYSSEANTEASAAQVSTALSVAQTRALLQEVPQAYNTQITEALLTALAQTFARWTKERSLLVDLEGHGREELFADVALSRTVGWFTTMFPVLLEIAAEYPGEALKSIKEQLRRIPQRGIGYGLLRYLSQNPETRRTLQALPQAEVSFNYLGQLDQMLSNAPLFKKLAQEPIGPLHSPLGQRSHLIEINGFIAEGRLQLDWTYSEQIHQRPTIEHLAQGFMAALQVLIAHCQSPEAGGYTPSDFPDVELSQENLDQILAEIEAEVK